VPLRTTTVSTARMPRFGQLAAIAAAAATASAVTIAVTDDPPAPQVRAVTTSAEPAAPRYFDLEANKAASMRALGRQIAIQRSRHTARYQDIEANKARNQSAR
jgi:hypothetical protein